MSFVLVVLLIFFKFMLAMGIYHYVLNKCLWILSIVWFLIKFPLYYGSIIILTQGYLLSFAGHVRILGAVVD